jgi:hypothetical protein
LTNPDGVAFGPYGNLYVANSGAGAFVNIAVSSGSSGFTVPVNMIFTSH